VTKQVLSLADAQQALTALEATRAAHVERGKQLPELRRNASYEAHVGGDPNARQALDDISNEMLTHQSELASLDDAISHAKVLVLAAQAEEADKVKRVGAAHAMETVDAFRKAGHDLDAALRQVAELGDKLKVLLSKLHAETGISFPSHEQLDALGYASIMTALLSTPWARRFRPMAPSQKRHFRDLFDGWAQVVEGRVRPLLAEAEENAA
jgi:hypothetical protein